MGMLSPTVRTPAKRLLAALLLAAAPASVARAQDPGALVEPVLLNRAEIAYPEALRKLTPPPQGRVVVKFVVGIDGAPRELEVTQGIHAELDALALAAVASLRYSPGVLGGRPVEVVKSVGIDIAAPPPDADAGEPGEARPAEAKPTEVSEGTAAPEGPVDVDGGVAGKGELRLTGVLLEAGQRTPVPGASVLIVPAPADAEVGEVTKKVYGEEAQPKWTMRAITRTDGTFEIRGVPDGKIRVIALTQGFDRFEQVEELKKGARVEVKYFQRRLVLNPYRTVVSARRNEPEEVSRRTISVQEINNLPGTQGDALKAIQNFPGVARPPFGAGLLVIRGAAPADSRTYLGYHEIPQLFHFGAITSVFNSDVLAQIDFIPGNFDSRFGNAIGGIINVQPRRGRRDGVHGYVDADLFDAGALIEGPIKKGSFVVSARRSYVDALLKAFIPKDAGIDFNVAPRYWDYQLLFDYPIREGNFTARVFGSDDQLAVVAPASNDTAPDANDGFKTQIAFHRADLVYEADHGPWSVLITPSFRHDILSGSGGNIFSFRVIRDSFNFRGELGYRFSKRAALRLGTEVNAGAYTLEARAPGFPQPGAGDSGGYFGASLGGPFATLALYGTATIAATDKLVFYPGVRFTYNAIVIKRAAVDPRIRWAWRFKPNTTLKGGVGLYSQVPDVFEFNDVWGNPKIALEKGVHNSLGIAHVFKDYDLSIEGTLFYKYVYSIAVATQALELATSEQGSIILPERFDNSGFGHIGGLELLIRKELTRNFFGWVSYTFLRAFYQINPAEGLRPFDFDQPHILTVIGVYKFPRGWSFGARFRLVSGNPTTEVLRGVYDSTSDSYIPISGPRNGGRLAPFHQLDLRVDKTWTWRYLKLNVYADVQNVYNRRNVEGTQYSYDFQQKKTIAGLPILPTLGAKLEF